VREKLNQSLSLAEAKEEEKIKALVSPELSGINARIVLPYNLTEPRH
jgi:hypothetical protein